MSAVTDPRLKISRHYAKLWRNADASNYKEGTIHNGSKQQQLKQMTRKVKISTCTACWYLVAPEWCETCSVL